MYLPGTCLKVQVPILEMSQTLRIQIGSEYPSSPSLVLPFNGYVEDQIGKLELLFHLDPHSLRDSFSETFQLPKPQDATSLEYRTDRTHGSNSGGCIIYT